MDAPIKLARATSPTESVEQGLYEIRKKIYPRAVHGKFAIHVFQRSPIFLNQIRPLTLQNVGISKRLNF